MSPRSPQRPPSLDTPSAVRSAFLPRLCSALPTMKAKRPPLEVKEAKLFISAVVQGMISFRDTYMIDTGTRTTVLELIL